MKALTVKQPWAGLIIAGGKDIENRTWRTSYRGRVLIHAAKTPVPYAEIRDCYPLPVARTALLYNSSNRALYPTSAIIGSVEIVDCVQNHPSEWAEKGVWNWVLANPIKFEKPIENVKGKLSCGSIAKIYNNNSRHTPQQMVRSHLTWRYRHIA